MNQGIALIDSRAERLRLDEAQPAGRDARAQFDRLRPRDAHLPQRHRTTGLGCLGRKLCPGLRGAPATGRMPGIARGFRRCVRNHRQRVAARARHGRSWTTVDGAHAHLSQHGRHDRRRGLRTPGRPAVRTRPAGAARAGARAAAERNGRPARLVESARHREPARSPADDGPGSRGADVAAHALHSACLPGESGIVRADLLQDGQPVDRTRQLPDVRQGIRLVRRHPERHRRQVSRRRSLRQAGRRPVRKAQRRDGALGLPLHLGRVRLGLGAAHRREHRSIPRRAHAGVSPAAITRMPRTARAIAITHVLLRGTPLADTRAQADEALRSSTASAT